MSLPRLGFVALLAACGGDPVHHLTDAPNIDIDAAPDAFVGAVTVTVLDPLGTGAPAVGIPAVFIAADGTLVARVATGSDGKATAVVEPGASVTIVEVSAASTQMQTVLAIQPGDNILLGDTQNNAAVGSFTVNFTPILGTAAAFTYQVVGPCGAVNTSTGTAVLPMTADCKLDTMEIQVFATSAAGVTNSYITKENVPFTAGGSTTLTTTFQAMTTFNASYTDLPAEVTNIGIDRETPDGLGFIESNAGVPDGTTLALAVPAPVTSSALIVNRFTGAGRSAQEILQNLAGNVTTYSVDAGGTLLAWLGTPTLDATTGIITVPTRTTGTSGDAPDLILVEARYSRVVGTATTSFQWLVFGGVVGDVTLPTLPAELGGVNPQAGDTIGVGIAAMIESDAIAGYAAVRATPYTILDLGQRFTAGTIRTSRSPTSAVN